MSRGHDDESAIAEQSSSSEQPYQQTCRTPVSGGSQPREMAPMPSTEHQPSINFHLQEPDDPNEFPAHDNYNIFVNLAVVSSDLKADDPEVIWSLELLTEETPFHLLILVFEDAKSAVAESYNHFVCLDKISPSCNRSASSLGLGIFVITHKSYVFSIRRLSSVEQNGYAISAFDLQLRCNMQEWLVIVCRFPPRGNEIPVAIVKYMIAHIDAGAVIITGLFGDTGPQLRNLFMNRGSGSAIHQRWLMNDENRVCTYPAYWVLLANHKPKSGNDAQELPYFQDLVDLGGTSASLIEDRPFESALLSVEDVPQWTVCADVPVRGSAIASAKNIGAVTAKKPDFKRWWFGIYQLPLWLGGSRTGKAIGPERKAKNRLRIAAKRRARQ